MSQIFNLFKLYKIIIDLADFFSFKLKVFIKKFVKIIIFFIKSIAIHKQSCYNVGMKIFSERLLELRKERGLSQATIARDLSVSLGIVCYWERNKSDPTASNIAKHARYFNVTSDYLRGLAE